MVMKTMRKNFHLLKFAIWAVVAAFVLSVGLPYLGPDPQAAGSPALVNGVPVSSQSYNQAYQQRLSSLRELHGDDIPGAEQQKVRKEILKDLIAEELALQGAKELGLEVNDDEYRQIIQAEQGFKNRQTGAYDPNLYFQFLSRQTQQGVPVEQAEN